jgi:sterol desaturase/sphingolipid hydroxylase (fatty acid hydroxylase superfamily)
VHEIVVFALPVFALCIALEFGYGLAKGRNTYRLNDAIASLSQGLLSQVVAACTQLFQVGLYAAAYPHVALLRDAPLWSHWPGWLLALLLYDLCDYWLHRVSHESAVFWAAHAVHHQSQCMNLSTALRQEPAYALLGWAFYLPMAVVGVPPALYAAAGLAVLLYQFWIHTEHVGALGWFDRVFSSPSNHRVHHAINDACLDKNYGAMLVLWDRLFGSFHAETEPCVYGTRTPLNSWDPLWATAQGYRVLWERMRRTPRWADKLRVLVKSPGWLPPGLHEQAPDDAGTSAGTVADRSTGIAQAVFDPPMRPAQRVVAVAGFLVVLAAGAAFLWRADALDAWRSAAAALGVAGGLWSVGAAMSGRLRTITAAGSIACCAAAALAACGGALPFLPIA